MPTLVYEHDGTRHGGVIDGRVLIGRRLTHGVIVVDPAVSRLHAWIARDEDGFYMLTDAGSRTGTFVNGQTITRHELQDGDRIEIGPALLTFLEDSALPDDVEPVALTSPQATVESSHAGILFDCQCGAPLWVGNELAGKRGLCRYCGEPIQVPTLKRGGRKQKPTPKPLAASRTPAAKIPAPAPVVPPPAPPEPPAAEPVDEKPAPPPAHPTPPSLEIPAPQSIPVEPTPREPPAAVPPEPLPDVVIKASPAAPTRSALKPRFIPLDMPSESDLLGDDPQPPTVFSDQQGLSDSRAEEAAALAVAGPRSARRPDLAACGVCHSAIDADEEITPCPDCQTTFHTDCWLENYGCSTYGCPQVNALKPAAVKAAEQKQIEVFTASSAAASAASAADAQPAAFPVELVLLAASAISALVGALLFGAVPLGVTLLSLFFLATRPLRRPGWVILAILIGLAGTVGGAALSDFWYFNGRHLAMLKW